MRDLLVLCPRMPPFNGADAQRVRTMLPHLSGLGWRATVVAYSEDTDAGGRDPALSPLLPDAVEIVRVRPWPRRVTGWVGIRQPALRAVWPMRRLLTRLLARRRFDAGLVSTTDFALWPLSLAWPFPVVLDWQDPWLTDYYDRRPEMPRPGGRLRFAAMQAIARRFEPRVARHAAGHVVVSAHYAAMLRDRYPEVAPRPFLELPFAASLLDLAAARRTPQRPPLLEGRSRWWVCAGRGGPDLDFALDALFRAIAEARTRSPGRFEDFGLLFVGTAYEVFDGLTPIAARARRHGIGDLVVEQPARLGQIDVYRLLDHAEAIVVAGSDDPAYVASRLAPALMTGRPLLAALHVASPAHRCSGAHAATRFVAFDPARDPSGTELAARLRAAWLDAELPAAVDAPALGTLEAGGMTAAFIDWLERCVVA